MMSTDINRNFGNFFSVLVFFCCGKFSVSVSVTDPVLVCATSAYSAYSVPVHVFESSTLANLCLHLHRPKFRIQSARLGLYMAIDLE